MIHSIMSLKSEIQADNFSHCQSPNILVCVIITTWEIVSLALVQTRVDVTRCIRIKTLFRLNVRHKSAGSACRRENNETRRRMRASNVNQLNPESVCKCDADMDARRHAKDKSVFRYPVVVVTVLWRRRACPESCVRYRRRVWNLYPPLPRRCPLLITRRLLASRF